MQKIKIKKLDDYFLKISQRDFKSPFFCRINEYSLELEKFLTKYIAFIRTNGLLINNKLKNPTDMQLTYYDNIIGSDFVLSQVFIDKSLKKWIPEISDKQINCLSQEIFKDLSEFVKMGKNENIIKNIFVKYMCWIYYAVRQILKNVYSDNPPKILYDGEISIYELHFLKILSNIGIDILLIRYGLESKYLTLDSTSNISEFFKIENGTQFSDDFSVLDIQKKVINQLRLQTLYNEENINIPATNIWLTLNILDDLLKNNASRGNEPKTFYNAFIRITGVEDKTNYYKQLYSFKSNLENSGKTVCVVEEFKKPSPEDVSKIKYGNYTDLIQMLADLVNQIKCPYPNLLNQAKKTFIDCFLEESENENNNLNKLKNKAIYCLHWINKYIKELFKTEESSPTLIYYGVCKTSAESLILRFFSYLPVDVIIINPNLNENCILSDRRLFDKTYENSMERAKFPQKIEDVKHGTVAYHAEKDLNEVLYTDSGMYRSQQYDNAVAITLETMYEEIYILWDEEIGIRPNFEIINNKVVIPAIIAKVCGVKDEDVVKYWKDVKRLITDDTIVISDVKFYNKSSQKFDPSNAIKNKILQKNNIIKNKNYNYDIFRKEVQEYMLDKLQELLDSKLIQGTFTTGSEYSIISIIMNLDKNITRLIQKMDFTKKNPKLILINTSEEKYGFEESTIIAYLHFIGFDIVLFTPTGYRVIEDYYTHTLFTEHIIGSFMYDIKIPNSIKNNSTNEEKRSESLFKKLIGR